MVTKMVAEQLNNATFDSQDDDNLTVEQSFEDEVYPLEIPAVKAVLILLYSMVFFTCVIGELVRDCDVSNNYSVFLKFWLRECSRHEHTE
jgi:hypothetical protein